MEKTKSKVYQLFKQNSELEVLISAAIVFTAFVINDVAGEWIVDALNSNISGSSPALFVTAIAGLYMSTMLPISIVSHFILRIYWLSLVGLRSVYPKREKLEVSKKFDKIVNSSLDLDRRIESIDKICSSIFAFTFLTLFAFCFSFISMSIIVYSASSVSDSSGMIGVITNLFVLLSLIYMLDFLTLGWFKKVKVKWFNVLYYPIYRFYGWVTLAFLYRGIYYSLIQHASRRIMLLITPIYMVLALFFMNLGYSPNTLYPDLDLATLKGELASDRIYRDQFPDKFVLRRPFLDSFVIPKGTDFMRVYFSLNQDIEENLLKACDGVQVFNQRGLHWRAWIQMNFNRIRYDSTFDYQENANRLLTCFSDNSSFDIDGQSMDPGKFYFSKLQRPDHAVVFTVLDVKDLDRGDHLLKVKSSEDLEGSEFYIPFWRD